MILDKLVAGPLKGAAQKMGWKWLDEKLTKAWPNAWPSIKHAMLGWKTLTGLAILYWPTIAAGGEEGFGIVNQILGLIGVHAHLAPAAFLVFMAKGLVYIGIADKALKFVIHFFSDEAERLPSPPVLESEADFESFLNRYAELRADGQDWATARRDALSFVLVNRKAVN